jgi:hypothetical protein
MFRTSKHIILPLIAPIMFFIVAYLPDRIISCPVRGFLAFSIALVAGILAISAAIRALITKVRKDATSNLWILTALILAVPAIYIVLFEI